MDALSKGRTYHTLPFALRLSPLSSVMLRLHETYTEVRSDGAVAHSDTHKSWP